MWIYGANSIHLAAKFMPQGLELLLSCLNHNSRVVDAKTDYECSPLHVAAANNDSLSTRYLPKFLKIALLSKCISFPYLLYLFIIFSVLLSYGANVDQEDSKGYTPLFYAASNCCLESLIELLDKGHADVHHVAKDNKKTALSKAHNYEAVMILTKYGAETNKKKDDLKRLMERHNTSSPRAILSQCISEVNEELLVLDLGHFKHTTKKDNEMYWHSLVQDHGKSELLLHPIFQVFLGLKWNQVKRFFWFNLLVDIIFVVSLTCSAYHFLNLIYCKPCDEIMDRSSVVAPSWSMKINTNNSRGTINCFSPITKCNENETCPDPEKLARFTDDSTSRTVQQYDTWENLSIKCHKNFLRYIRSM